MRRQLLLFLYELSDGPFRFPSHLLILRPQFPHDQLQLVDMHLALLGDPLALPAHLLDQLGLLQVRLARGLELPLEGLGVRAMSLQLRL